MSRALPEHLSLNLCRVQTAQRAEVQAFISQCFAEHYNARVEHFMPDLLALRGPDGSLQGALGLRFASQTPLFCEQYLYEPVEQLISHVQGELTERSVLIEVGQLAAHDAGSARALIIHATAWLAAQGLRYVVFTGTRQLRNSFARLGLRPQFLAQAEAARLGAAGAAWGDYYSTTPQVMFGDIQLGDRQLRERGVYAALGLQCVPEVDCA